LRSDENLDDGEATMSQKVDVPLDLPPDKKYSLAVLQGKSSGQIFPITKSRTVIGRSGTDVLLDDAECSRRHAELEIHGSRATIRDLDSTNGTFVDGKRIDKADLDAQSEFRVGDHVMMLIVTDRE
jgi:S-DNA-T family DNA segregation ATPase FtsK/SpoIIIE